MLKSTLHLLFASNSKVNISKSFEHIKLDLYLFKNEGEIHPILKCDYLLGSSIPYFKCEVWCGFKHRQNLIDRVEQQW